LYVLICSKKLDPSGIKGNKTFAMINKRYETNLQ
jgi:hypothetical protein